LSSRGGSCECRVTGSERWGRRRRKARKVEGLRNQLLIRDTERKFIGIRKAKKGNKFKKDSSRSLLSRKQTEKKADNEGKKKKTEGKGIRALRPCPHKKTRGIKYWVVFQSTQ